MPTIPPHPESLWLHSSKPPLFPTLTTDLTVDVAIIGGGVTGLTAATLLHRAGLKVAILDAHRIAHAESGHTTAHLTAVVDLRYQQLISQFGEDTARHIAHSHLAAIDRIEALVNEYQIPCDFHRLPAYLYTESPADAQQIAAESHAFTRLGITASLTSPPPLPFPIAASLQVPNQAQFHPEKYLATLARILASQGVPIFENTKAEEFQDGSPCRVKTPVGTVTAQHVIVATNVPVNNWAFLQSKIASYRTYVLALRLKNAAPLPDALLWDTADPYHYLHSHPESNHLIVGGEDHKTGHDTDTEKHFRQLLEYTQARFPVEAVEYKWSGQIVEPVDGIPYIGKNSLSTHTYVATGYSGNGITYGTLAAMLLSDAILNIPNPWLKIYDPARISPAAALKDFISENLDTPLHLIADRLTPADASALDDVLPGQGKILSLNHQKIAVHRDAADRLHACSPVCTHMACHVAWNNAEQTWDCPCHGSRFTPDGIVVNGPATKNLTPLTPETPP